MGKMKIAYLGPPGTYSHILAIKRFGHRHHLVPFPSITETCTYVEKHHGSIGIVPIENSSGGAIHETVDILINYEPKVHIIEELSLNVRLALLGHKGEKIKTLYSHFAPLEHSAKWIKRHLPHVVKQIVSSTALAAQRASEEPTSAALGSRNLASMYGLDILHYPIEADVPNITTFLCISSKPLSLTSSRSNKMTVVVHLPNKPGSLCTLLEVFKEESVNLTRLISRPIRGLPREYAFLIDLDGSLPQENVRRAISKAKKVCERFRIAGCFNSRPPYTS